MAWTEAPASGESRRSTVIPHAFRHRVSSRLYHSVDFADGRFIPQAVIGGSRINEGTSRLANVRSWKCFDRRQCLMKRLPQLTLSDLPSVMTEGPKSWQSVCIANYTTQNSLPVDHLGRGLFHFDWSATS